MKFKEKRPLPAIDMDSEISFEECARVRDFQFTIILMARIVDTTFFNGQISIDVLLWQDQQNDMCAHACRYVCLVSPSLMDNCSRHIDTYTYLYMQHSFRFSPLFFFFLFFLSSSSAMGRHCTQNTGEYIMFSGSGWRHRIIFANPLLSLDSMYNIHAIGSSRHWARQTIVDTDTASRNHSDIRLGWWQYVH